MFLLIYVTHPDRDCAQRITDALLNDKLIACANVFPIESAYWWQGNIEREGEIVSLVKTIPAHWERLVARVTELHPYDVPCILQMEVTANADYEQWIRESCSNGA